MPTYDYRCGACGHLFEHFQSMTSAKLVDCPECGAPRLERLIGGGAGVIFKGGGFYETDYKRKPVGSVTDPSANDDGDSSDSKSGASSSSGSDSSSKSDTPASDTKSKSGD